MNTKQLSEKVLNGETLTPEEREVAAQILSFGESLGAAVHASRKYGGVLTLTGSRADDAEGDTPTFFIVAAADPHPDTWAAIRAATDPDTIPPIPTDVQEKADLWDAFLGAGRLRMLGWAGSEDDKEIRHFGAEFWVAYPGHDFTETNTQAQKLITAFARTVAAVQAEAKEPGESK